MSSHILIRLATLEDAQQIGQFIYDTIRIINRKDYDDLQVKTWAPDPFIYSTYEDSYAYVADLNGLIVGFANLTHSGYLNRFYIQRTFKDKALENFYSKL